MPDRRWSDDDVALAELAAARLAAAQ